MYLQSRCISNSSVTPVKDCNCCLERGVILLLCQMPFFVQPRSFIGLFIHKTFRRSSMVSSTHSCVSICPSICSFCKLQLFKVQCMSRHQGMCLNDQPEGLGFIVHFLQKISQQYVYFLVKANAVRFTIFTYPIPIHRSRSTSCVINYHLRGI